MAAGQWGRLPTTYRTEVMTPAAPAPTKPDVPNVLAARYASVPLVALWAPTAKVVLERRLWLAVLQAQADLGVAVPTGVGEDYARVVASGALASTRERERVTRHDVKA